MQRCVGAKSVTKIKNRHTEDTVRSIAWLVKFTRHPKLGATHVANCVNVGGICNDHLKSFSGAIILIKDCATSAQLSVLGKISSFLGERASVRVKRVTHAKERVTTFSIRSIHFSLLIKTKM